MNPPPPPIKRGKYSTNLAANLDSNDQQQKQINVEMAGSSSSMANPAAMMKPKDGGWKPCDYVSNRTRLRCQNQRRQGHQLREYGFCEEHIGYIERIRKEGLRSKHLFDPSFEISQNFMQLISCDDDETLEPRSPQDFPFVYESMYCDGRFDNDENPLRPARIYTQEEIAEEYAKSLKRLNSSLREQRTIYKEKHIRLLQQIARINGQPDKGLLLDPVKEAEKIAHLLLMRKEAMKKDREMAARNKFARMDEETVESCSQRRMKWQKPMELDNNEGTSKEEQKAKEEGIGVRMVLDGINKIINENQMEEENICLNSSSNNSILILENDNKPKEVMEIMMDRTMVCARINRPFDGRRNANSILPAQIPRPNSQQQKPMPIAASSSYASSSATQQMNMVNNNIANNSKINHHHHHQNNIKNNNITNNNKIIRNVVDHDYELPTNSTTSNNLLPPPAKKGRPPSTPLQQIAKTQMPIIGCIGSSSTSTNIGGGTTNSYQQYLQQRHHIQVKQMPSIGLGLGLHHHHHRPPHQPISLSRNQIYGNGLPPPQIANANNNNKSATTTTINNAKRTRTERLK